MTGPSPTAAACLARTRSAVLNLLIASGTGIAISGWLLRWRDRWAFVRAPRGMAQGLLVGLAVIAAASFVIRRSKGSRGPEERSERFYRRHVWAAVLATLVVPLGLAYGWLVRPRLDVVGPFWIVALTLGLLALPRAHEYECLGSEESGPGPSESHP